MRALVNGKKCNLQLADWTSHIFDENEENELHVFSKKSTRALGKLSIEKQNFTCVVFLSFLDQSIASGVRRSSTPIHLLNVLVYIKNMLRIKICERSKTVKKLRFLRI